MTNKSYKINSAIIAIYFSTIFLNKDASVLISIAIAFASLAITINFFYKKDSKKPVLDSMSMWLIFSMALLIINYFTREYGNVDPLGLIIFFALLIPVYVNISNTGLSFNTIKYSIYFAAVAGAGAAIYQIENAVGFNGRATGSITAQLFGTANVIFLTYFIARFVTTIKLLKVDRQNRKPLKIELSVCFLSILGSLTIIYLTGSRSPVIVLAALLFFHFIYFKLYKSKATIATIIAATALASWFGYAQKDSVFIKRLITATKVITTGERNSDGSVNERINIMVTGIDIYKENPFLGVGISAKPQAILDAKEKLGASLGYFVKGSEMHSTYLDIAVQFGSLGLVMYAIYLLIIIKKSLHARHYLTADESVLLYSYILALIVFGLTDVTIGYVSGGIIFTLPLVILVAYTNFRKKNPLAEPS